MMPGVAYFFFFWGKMSARLKFMLTKIAMDIQWIQFSLINTYSYFFNLNRNHHFGKSPLEKQSWRDMLSLDYPLIYHLLTQCRRQASLGCVLSSKLTNGKCWERQLSSLDHPCCFLESPLPFALLQVPHLRACADLLPPPAGDRLRVHRRRNHAVGQRNPRGFLWSLSRASLC